MLKVFAYMPTPGGLTGAPRRLLTLATVLSEQGIEMCIATQRDSALLQAAEERGLETVEVEPVAVLRQRHSALFGGNAVFRLKALFSLLVQNLVIARKIRAHGADVVWIRSSKGIAFGGLGAVLSRRPLVWDIGYELPFRGMVRWLHRFGLWAACRAVFQYSAAPDAIFTRALAARHQNKFHTIIPGIDLSRLEALRTKKKAREPSGRNAFVVLQVGTVCARKNQQLLIDALVQVRQAPWNGVLRVQLVGEVFEEEYAQSVKRKINSGGLDEEVELLGWRTDVHELMAAADLLVMPSNDEGVPNTVQEAMAIGLPVVVSSAGGMPEIVSDGETGWIISTGNPEGLARRIIWCLANPEASYAIGQRGAVFAARYFGTQEWGNQYRCLIQEVVASNVSKVRKFSAFH